MPLPFTHLTSTKQIDRESAELILSTAQQMEEVVKQGGSDLLKGKILASLFYEPSTRTRLSFEAAMLRLGGEVISAEGIQFSSLYKGETIEDTMRMVSSYADIIAMRHPEQGIADRAITAATIPFINAGDGPGQHPTQALLDLCTIQKERGVIDGLSIAMVGDLRFGRTVHSLSYLLGLYNNIRFTLVSPAELQMPEKVTSFFDEKGISYTLSDNMEDALQCDVLYMTRVQQERFTDRSEYERLKDRFVLTAEQLINHQPTILHPLPRVGEIHESVDSLPCAAYFRQAQNGLFVRMALLALLLKKIS
jgi:aspartate carbamoyltransferase catalytic subunit